MVLVEMFKSIPLSITLVPVSVTVWAPAKRMLLTSVGPTGATLPTLPVTFMFAPAVQVVVPLVV